MADTAMCEQMFSVTLDEFEDTELSSIGHWDWKPAGWTRGRCGVVKNSSKVKKVMMFF